MINHQHFFFFYAANYATCEWKICSETRHAQEWHLTSKLPPLSEYEVALQYFLTASMSHDWCCATPLQQLLVT